MRKKISLLCMFTIVGLFAGCAKVTTINNNVNIQKDYYVYSTEKIPDTLAPVNNLTTRENDIICSLFEGLVEINEKGEVMPALSKGWKISEDKIEYTFELLDNAKWSDGTKITSFDFIDYFKSILAPGNENYKLDELDTIYGVKLYREGQADFEQVAIKATDNKTLTIRLNEPDDKLLYKLSKPIYRLRSIKEDLDEYKNKYYSIRYSGPYKITEVILDNTITIEKNENYVGEFKGVNTIVIKKKLGEEIAFASYNVGEVDILSNPPISSFEQGSLYKYIYTYPTDNIKCLVFNTNNSVTNLIDFRKGLFNALNLEIADTYLIKNNISTWTFREIRYSDLINGNLKKDILNLINDDSNKNLMMNKANSLLSKIDMREKNIVIVALDNLENRTIGDFVENILNEKYSIATTIKYYDEEVLKQILQNDKYDILITDINLSVSDETLSFLESKKEVLDKELSIISLCYTNDIICKSDYIRYVFIDGNGNLLFKYIQGMN